MPDFQTTGQITLQPGDSMGYAFEITVASAANANDGYIPFGTNVASVSVVAYNSDGTDVTSLLIVGTPTVTSNVINIRLQYPGTNGRYKLTFDLTLDNGWTKEADFGRVIAEDR